MGVYRRILLVVDLTEGSLAIGRKAQALAAALGAEVELLHVVEFVPVEPMGETLMPSVQIEEELLERARQRLAGLCAELGLSGSPCWVEVETSYLDEQSDPRESRYVFSYTITIRNEGKVPARLLTRHWVITDANGKVEEVRGDGVVGEQPYLKPGQGFRYSSGAVLETP